MRRRSKYLVLLLVFVFAAWLTGCGGEEAPANFNFTGGEAGMQEPSEPEPARHDESIIAAQQRVVIVTGEMTVESQDPANLVDYIAKLAQRSGGYVTDQNLEQRTWGEETYIEGSISIRVPAEKLDGVIKDIEAQDVVLISKDLNGEDVTAEYVDLKSRLRNLEAAEEQLQEIMDRSNDTEAVLKVYQELAKVTEEAEVVRGQIQYYDEASAMSSLTINIEPIFIEQEPERWQLGETFESASNRLSTSFERWLNGAINFFVYGLPIFVLRAGPWLVAFFFIGRWGYRRFRGNNKQSDQKEPKTIGDLEK